MLNPSGLRLVRRALSEADDDKIRKVVALLDQESTPDAANAILDSLRPRLAILRPTRRLRFARLLFTPLNEAIVPAQAWRPGVPAVPRSALAPLALTVREALGDEIVALEREIADSAIPDDDTVAKLGNRLWPRAAAILAGVPEPVGWDATGLPTAFYPAMARAIAAVLRRTGALHDLVRQTATGTVAPDQTALQELLTGLSAESPEGFGIVIALLLERLPFAAMQIQRVVASSRGSAESALLRQALDEGVDRALTRMETAAGFDGNVRNAPLRNVGQEVQRIAALLRDIESEPDTARHRHRLKAIRTQLNLACRDRFGAGLDEGLIAPLTAAEPVTAVAQSGMETNARELRMLEMAARKVGNPALYDSLLEKAAAIVVASTNAGVLTPVRQARLIEILAGPEAAEAVYRQNG